MKKVFCASLSICFFARLWAATDLHFQWTVEASAPLPYHAEAMQGETFTLSATLHQYGQALSGPATATFYYQTTEMSQTQWYSAPATWASATGKASLQWSSALDIGHTKYRFFFGIETSQGKNYRAFGTLRLKPSPGFSPATLEPTDVRELFKQEILAEVLQSLESTFAPTVHAHDMDDIDGLQSALNAKQDTLTAGENITIENGTISAAGGKITVDTALSSTSTNPVQNKVIKNALDGKANVNALNQKADKNHYHDEYVSTYSSAMAMDLGEGFELDAYRALFTPYGAVLGVTEINGVGYIAWRGIYDGLVHRFALGGGKVDVDSELSFQSTNPVQNKVVASALYDVRTTSVKFNKNPSAGFEEFKGGSGRAFTFNDDRDHTMEMGIKEGKIAWTDGNGTKHEMTLGGGDASPVEVWKGNVGFGEQDTFFGAKKTTDGDGQFLNGYPRLHNHGQDIHEVSGFSRDSRDDETVWSHRLLLPWDLAKANDTSYLMAGVVWEGSRNIFANGDTATFVQPLLPTNNGSTKSYLPYAIPCFENSPVFWNGTIIWNDGTSTISKAVRVPWSRVQQDMRSPDELALKRDVDGKQDKLTAGENITIKNGVISAAGGASDDEEPWVSPGDWHLTVRSSEDYATVSTTEVTTATQGDRVMGETTVTTHASPIKDVSVEMLDLSRPSAPIPVTFTCEGATLTPSSSACRASATTEGLYRIFATDAQGRTRDAYLNLRTKTKATTTKAYLSDVEGSARKVANDRMLSVLAARDRSNTIAVGQTSTVAACDKAFNGTTPLSTAPLAPAYFCVVEPKTSWGPDAVAVSPHFAITAAHWQPSATKTATFVTPDGSVSTVSGTTGTSLTAWARANGYSESEIDEADIDDIYVWHFSSGTIPDACIPYVMDVKARETYYKDDLYGIVAYTITQNGYLSYAPLLAADGSRYAFGTFNATTTRADMLEHLAPACCATIYGGDSGRPVLMIHDEKPVLLSTFWTAGSGPSFVKACDILDAYIHQQSGGAEALKRIE